MVKASRDARAAQSGRRPGSVCTFRAVREVVATEYRDLPSRELRRRLQGALGAGVAPEDMEGWFDSLKQGLAQGGRALAKQLPGVVQGVARTYAGPYAALAGGVIKALTRPSPAAVPSAPAPAAAPPVVPPVPAPPPPPAPIAASPAGGKAPAESPAAAPGPAAAPPSPAPKPAVAPAPPAPGGAPSAGVLLGLIDRPEIRQALMSTTLGALGRRTVPVRKAAVPVGEFLNLIGRLARQAEAEYDEAVLAADAESSYLYESPAEEPGGEPEEPGGEPGEEPEDPSNPDVRAALVLRQLYGGEPAAEPPPAPAPPEAPPPAPAPPPSRAWRRPRPYTVRRRVQRVPASRRRGRYARVVWRPRRRYVLGELDADFEESLDEIFG